MGSKNVLSVDWTKSSVFSEKKGSQNYQLCPASQTHIHIETNRKERKIIQICFTRAKFSFSLSSV
jgi:hypothetical protein